MTMNRALALYRTLLRDIRRLPRYDISCEEFIDSNACILPIGGWLWAVVWNCHFSRTFSASV